MRKISLLLALFSLNVSAQNIWSSAEVASIFDLLHNQSPAVAVAEVEARGVTAFDFGMDLVAMGQNDQALNWFEALILNGGEIKAFVFGKAWVQKEAGDLGVAMVTANQLLSMADNNITKARAHYMLGTIFQKGSNAAALLEFQVAEALYQSLDMQGGVALCQLAAGQPQFKTGSLALQKGGSTPPPPRDDSGS